MSTNLFNGINIGLKSLQVSRTALDTTGHNIANANTEGYSRQRVTQSASQPYTVPSLNSPGGAGQIGTGVRIDAIERMRDQFIDRQINQETQKKGYWDKIAEGLTRIEATFNEPSDASLNSALSSFWQSLQDLSNSPTDPATRSTVKQRANVLIDSFHTIGGQLFNYKESLNQDVGSMVTEINSIGARIADLNQQIIGVEASGQQPNDLLDKRDKLFSDLSQLINVSQNKDNMGNMQVSINGVSFVSKSNVYELELVDNHVPAGGDPYDRLEQKVVFARSGSPIFSDDNIEALQGRGELAGSIAIRNEEIDHYINQLDEMAKAFVDEFNKVHQNGYDANGNRGAEFFTYQSNTDHAALGIDLTNAIKNEQTGTDKIAAGNYSDDPKVAWVGDVTSATDNNYKVEITDDNSDGLYDYTITEYAVGDPNQITAKYTAVDIPEGTEINLSSLAAAGFDTTDPAYNPAFQAEFKVRLDNVGEANISLQGSKGNGTNALALAETIRINKIIGDSSLTEKYEQLISTLGVDGQRSNQMINNQSALLNQLGRQQEAVSGVSLDEEMANMIKYQHAYTAASKIITTTDELIRTLLGVVR